MKKILSTLLLICTLSISAFTQIEPHRKCAAKITKDDSKELTSKINSYIWSNALSSNFNKEKVVKIPIVFHVLYDTVSINNEVTKEVLDKQVQTLNTAYRMKNSKHIKEHAPKEFAAVAADSRIEFYIDSIIRKKADNIEFHSDLEDAKYDSLGGSSVYKPKNHLNIWVCNLEEGLVGYGQFPGENSETDGVVISYHTLSIDTCSTCWWTPFNQGKTLIHEVGHWLGLLHIWGDDCPWGAYGPWSCIGTDDVDDTPNQGCDTWGCPEKTVQSCGNDVMYMNYMDYTDDECMYMFTKGQVKRMRATLKLFRSGFLK